MASVTQQQPARFYRIDEICDLLGLSKTTVRSLIKDRGFPQPKRFSQRTVRWDREKVDAWMARQPEGQRN